MAGIAFALRPGVRKASYARVVGEYAVAGAIGSGPWVISILSMAVIGLGHPGTHDSRVVSTFLGTVTHLMAYSMILAGGLQLVVARYCADRIYERKLDAVAPNVLGALSVTTATSGVIGAAFVFLSMEGRYAYRALVVTGFVVLTNIWIVSVILSALREYAALLWTYLFGYTLTVGATLALARFGLAGLMAGFCVGHCAMFFAMLAQLGRKVPPPSGVTFGFFDRKKAFFDLAVIGFLFNVAVWGDKFVFWWHPITATRLFGPIRGSIVYDAPVSLAYLSVIPAMAVFFVRIETEFAREYDSFFRDLREGSTLDAIERQRDALVTAARASIHDIFRVQAVVVAVLLLAAPSVLKAFHIPSLYLYLFRIDIVGVACQVVLLGILTLLFYLDHRRAALVLVCTFAAINVFLSLLSVRLGVRFYGYGFAIAAAVTSLLGLVLLSRRFDRLEFATFVGG